MKLLKTREDAIKEAEYWKQSYSDTLKELLDVKAENQLLKNTYEEDLEDVLNILISLYQKIKKNYYVPKHAKGEK